MNLPKSYLKRKQSKNNKKIFFYLLAILIGFTIYYLIFGFQYFESKTLKVNIDKDKEEPIHLSKNYNLSFNYDDFAKKLFIENKTISFDYLDENIYGIKRDYSNFDNIHLLFAFNPI